MSGRLSFSDLYKTVYVCPTCGEEFRNPVVVAGQAQQKVTAGDYAVCAACREPLVFVRGNTGRLSLTNLVLDAIPPSWRQVLRQTIRQLEERSAS